MAQKEHIAAIQKYGVTDPPKDIYKEFHVIMNVSVQMTEKRMKKDSEESEKDRSRL